MKKFILFFIFYAPFISFSQEIKGKVSDVDNTPIVSATVILYEIEDKILDYATTDENGLFKFKSGLSNVLKIEVSSIGFKTKIIAFEGAKFYDIKLEEEAFNLKEIEITAKILKDTVDLSISENLTEQSSLKDILIKNNNLEVSENGTIFYEGKPINKILINQKEVFVNQNNLAINNITKEMIEKVQVINNYKDKFSFNFENERNTVINIETKSKFKGVMKNNIEMHVGHQNAFLLKLKSMFFSDKLNLFLTNNTNNVLEGDFKFADNNAEMINLSSTYYKDMQNDFTSENKNANNSFLSSSSLTLRKEMKKSKFSLILYQNTVKNIFKTSIERSENNNLINEQAIRNEVKGTLNMLNFQYNRLLNEKNILTFDSHVGYSDKSNESLSTTFSNESNSTYKIHENYSAKIFNMINTLSLKQKFQNNFIGAFDFHLYHENAYNFFKNDQTINQDINYKSTKLKTNYLFDYSIGKNNINFGLEFLNNVEKLNTHTDDFVNKEAFYSLPVIFRGESKKINYFFKTNMSLWNNEVNTIKVKRFLVPVSLSVRYKMDAKKSVNLYFERNYKKNETTQTVPDYFKDSFTKFLSDVSFNNQLTTNNSLGVQYTYYNFSKSHFFKIESNGSLNSNPLNYIYNGSDNNVLFYKAILSNNQIVISNNLTYSKGWYFSNKLHKITVSPRYEFTFISNDINQMTMFSSQNFNQKYLFSFEPNKWLLKEIAFSYSINYSTFFENNIKTNNLKVERYNLSFLAENNKVEFKSNFFIELFSGGTSNIIIRKDVNLSFIYKALKKINLTCYGNSVLTLFKLDNPVANIATSNNQGIVTVVTNPNILGSLLIGFQFKF
jgi:hypothetical protein